MVSVLQRMEYREDVVMNVAMAAAGVLTLALALGHATIGMVWVLPRLRGEDLPVTPFGPQTATAAMIRVTWHVVTLFALTSGVVLVVLAAAPDTEPTTLLLRAFALMWLAATGMAFVTTRPRLRSLTRLPVPFLWIAVALLCWKAST